MRHWKSNTFVSVLFTICSTVTQRALPSPARRRGRGWSSLSWSPFASDCITLNLVSNHPAWDLSYLRAPERGLALWALLSSIEQTAVWGLCEEQTLLLPSFQTSLTWIRLSAAEMSSSTARWNHLLELLVGHVTDEFAVSLRPPGLQFSMIAKATQKTKWSESGCFETSQSKAESCNSVVFVHGLRGNAETTWAKGIHLPQYIQH